jgi:hypothetical protein
MSVKKGAKDAKRDRGRFTRMGIGVSDRGAFSPNLALNVFFLTQYPGLFALRYKYLAATRLCRPRKRGSAPGVATPNHISLFTFHFSRSPSLRGLCDLVVNRPFSSAVRVSSVSRSFASVHLRYATARQVSRLFRPLCSSCLCGEISVCQNLTSKSLQ